MGTRATVEIIGDTRTLYVHKFLDGYPDFMLPLIKKTYDLLKKADRCHTPPLCSHQADYFLYNMIVLERTYFHLPQKFPESSGFGVAEWTMIRKHTFGSREYNYSINLKKEEVTYELNQNRITLSLKQLKALQIKNLNPSRR